MTRKFYAYRSDFKKYMARPYRFIPNGNLKIYKDVLTFSTFKGHCDYIIVDKYGYESEPLKGTCTGCDSGCDHSCYVNKSYNLHGSSVGINHYKNTYGIRYDFHKMLLDLNKQLQRYTKKGENKIIRLNQSGEIESQQEMNLFLILAALNPNHKFYVYVKSYDLIIKNAKHLENIRNITVNISIWHDIGIDCLRYLQDNGYTFFNAFVYIDKDSIGNIYDYEKLHGLKIDCYCNAYDINGNMDHSILCGGTCHLCINRKGLIIGCYDH